jgi:heptosyltransferase II
LSENQKILILAPSWVGDAVMSLGFIQGLKQKIPAAEIDVLAGPWCQAVYQLHPDVHQVIPCNFPHGAFNLMGRWRCAQELRKKSYQTAYVLPNSWKSALIPFFAKIPERVGYLGEGRWGLLTTSYAKPKNLPLLIQQYQYLAALGEVPLEPKLAANPIAQTKVLAKFNLTQEQPIMVFCPGAEYGPAKQWPTESFRNVANHFNHQGWQIWLLGSPKDQEVAKKITSPTKENIVNLIGQTTLEEAIHLLGAATVVVTNDSGLMHVAASLSRPTLALFGSSSPTYTPPLSKKAKILYKGVSCSPCFQRVCPLTGDQHLHCLTLITPMEVQQMIEQLMRESCDKN